MISLFCLISEHFCCVFIIICHILTQEHLISEVVTSEAAILCQRRMCADVRHRWLRLLSSIHLLILDQFFYDLFSKPSPGTFDELLQFCAVLSVGGWRRGVGGLFPAFLGSSCDQNVSPQCENGGTVPTTLFDVRAE